MRDMLRKLRPDRFEDIIAVVALYRPGPMENIPRYIAVKHGEEAPDYLHPSLRAILEETHGIMIYQEQVMQIAQVLSGYSLGGADLLRRAMGKKIKAEMEAQRTRFIDGAVARGVGPDLAEHIFEQVAKFAGYGFNKSHAAAYALLAYQTAYLKANHPVEFMAAFMSLLHRQYRQAQRLPPGMRPARHQAPATRHQPLGRGVHGRDHGAGTGDPLCAGGGEGRRRAGDAVARRRARARTDRFADLLRFRPPARSAQLQPAPVRRLGQGRRVRCAQSQPRAKLRRDRAVAAPCRCRGQRAGEPAGQSLRRRGGQRR